LLAFDVKKWQPDECRIFQGNILWFAVASAALLHTQLSFCSTYCSYLINNLAACLLLAVAIISIQHHVAIIVVMSLMLLAIGRRPSCMS